MIETLVAMIGVMFAPMFAKSLSLPGGFVANMLFNKLVILVVTVVYTIGTNVIRAYRYCRSKEKSRGISYGLKKGLVCGVVAILASMAIKYIPALQTPFSIVENFIPGYGSSLLDGVILSFFYLISYMVIAYPIWGSC